MIVTLIDYTFCHIPLQCHFRSFWDNLIIVLQPQFMTVESCQLDNGLKYNPTDEIYDGVALMTFA